MEMRYPHPALEAELAYRREQIKTTYREANRRGRWSRRRRPS